MMASTRLANHDIPKIWFLVMSFQMKKTKALPTASLILGSHYPDAEYNILIFVIPTLPHPPPTATAPVQPHSTQHKLWKVNINYHPLIKI